LIANAGLDGASPFGGVRFALARASGWAMAEYLAYPLMMLAAMPLYLWALGTVQYGQWMLLLTVTGFGGLAGLGMGPTATLMVAAARGRGNADLAIEGARACLAITLTSAALLSGAILLFGWTLGARIFAKVGTPDQVLTIIAFGGLLLLLEQIDAVFAGILRGLERFDLSARLEISAKMGQVACTALAAWQTRNLLAVFATASCVAVARTSAKMIAAQRQFSDGWLWPKWSPDQTSKAFRFGRWIWLQSAGSLMFAVMDRTLIGALLGAEALAKYAVALQLAQQIQTIPAAGAQVLFPAIAKRVEVGQDWRRLAMVATLAMGVLGLAGAILLIAFGPWFLRLWVGRAMSAAVGSLLIPLSIGYLTLSFSAAPHHVLMGAGRVKLVAVVTIIAGVIAASVTPWSIHRWGLVGAPFGRVAYGVVALWLVAAMWQMARFPGTDAPARSPNRGN
jgi:O-antigen/teichoic acid export membrane protein